MRALAGISIVVAAAAWPTRAHGNPDGVVPSATTGDRHVVAAIDYSYEVDRSQLFREATGDGSPDGPVPLHKDLVFHQYKHTITPRLEIGVLTDTWIYGALPIVVAQDRELRLDSGVDRSSSSTLEDGLLPMAGFDAQNPNVPPAGDLVFRGPTRHGLDQVHLGIGVAPMNQARDDTKPTWKIGAEARLAIGKVMRFDPMAPGANTAVGYGVHELKLWTTFDRRIGWAEPWAEFFWQVPLASTGASLFQNPGFGSTNNDKAQQAGASFGFEAYAVDNADHNRVSLDLGTKIVAHFEGRDYSELWEVLAYAGDDRVPGNPLILDSDPVTPGVQAKSYPGISNIENYLETTAHAALRAELGPHVRASVIGDVTWISNHYITFANAGVDRNGDNLINPGTTEINPAYVDRIDLVGHRYESMHGLTFAIGVEGMVMF
ncbi:MAG TPA: hypothetical protein VLX92_26055 [Kofleriaceae bacterium]|nr:hypothetical protein [Kofleriaceae bacterium]